MIVKPFQLQIKDSVINVGRLDHSHRSSDRGPTPIGIRIAEKISIRVVYLRNFQQVLVVSIRRWGSTLRGTRHELAPTSDIEDVALI